MIRKFLIACLVFSAPAVWVNAQQQGGGQGAQTPQPAPAPQPAPTQPRQPSPTPQPGPSPQTSVVSVRGRIIITDTHSSYPMIEVKFETDGGQPIGYAYADSSGEFTFQRAGISLDQTMYVVIQLVGYKPYRERLGGVFGMSAFEGLLTIFLERETTIRVDKPGGSPVVDLKQLRAKISGKAVGEYEKALKESSKGNRNKAVESLERAVKLAPDFYEAQHTLGVQYLGLQKYQEAETSFLKARDLSPRAAEPLINLGTLYYQRGESQSDAGHPEDSAGTFQKAAEFLEESVRRSPVSASAHRYLGAALYKTASYERAESMLHRALELDEEEHDARLMLINVYTKQARYTEALEQIDIYFKKNPKAPQRPALEGIKAQIQKILAK